MRSVLTMAMMVLVSASLALADGGLVTLKVTDGEGIPRMAEPVTNGVPFPEGAVTDLSKLRVTSSGGVPVPAAFTATCLWQKDKSVRWALLDAELTAPANGSGEYTISVGTPVPPTRPIKVDEAADLITVDTGKLKFTVRPKGFRLFESVWVDETGSGTFVAPMKVLAEPEEGLAMTVKGTRYTSAGDTASKVVVEEKNPMRVTLLATGKLAGGGDSYDYAVRIHAYTGSAVVKVVATVTKKYGRQRDGGITFQDLSLGLKLVATKDLTYALGGDASDKLQGNHMASGKLEAGKTASVLVSSSDDWKFGGVAEGSGKCKTTKPLTLGWGDLSGPLGGVAVGVRRFWQVWPKAIELSGDGTVNIGLMPKLSGIDQEFYTGMARTHEILMVFHGRPVAASEMQKKFVAFQRPLFAQAPAEWYCQKTQAFGPLAAEGATLPGDAGPAVKKEDATLIGYFDKLYGEWCDKGTPKCPGLDAYGFIAYGDSLHHFWGNPSDKWTVQWDSHYYDIPHMALLMWARSGERKVLDYYVDNTWHLEDVGVVHWTENPKTTRGGSRRCPAMNHVGYDGNNPKEPSWNEFDHHKSESLFERYYLLGDKFALECAQDLLYLADNPVGADGQPGYRHSAHQTLTLVAGYLFTGDKKYLDHARKVVQTNMDLIAKNGGGLHADGSIQFADGIVGESMAKYYLVTGDEDVFKSIQAMCDWSLNGHTKEHWYSNWSMIFALTYSKTQDAKYLTGAVNAIPQGNTDNIGKDIAESWRNYPYTSGLLLMKK